MNSSKLHNDLQKIANWQIWISNIYCKIEFFYKKCAKTKNSAIFDKLKKFNVKIIS